MLRVVSLQPCNEIVHLTVFIGVAWLTDTRQACGLIKLFR